MGNPESKPVESSSNGSSNKKTSSKLPTNTEDVPYTAFSLPITKSNNLSSESLRAMEIQDLSNGTEVNRNSSKNGASSNQLQKSTSLSTIESILPFKLFSTAEKQSSPQTTEPELQQLKSLPPLEVLLPQSVRSVSFLDEQGKFNPNFELDVLPALLICAEYQEVCNKYGAAISKHQREIINQIKNVDVKVADTWDTMRKQSNEIFNVQNQLLQVDSVFNQIKTMNENLQQVIKSIEVLCKILPDDMKMEDTVPVPLLTLGSHNEEHQEKYALFSKAGLAPTTRGTVWFHAIGNSLNITEEHYIRYSELVETHKKRISENIVTDTEFVNLVRLIKLDVPRTFPKLGDISSKDTSVFYDEVRKILEAFIIFRPSVGYSQGMTHVAGMLLLHMNEVEAFISLTNLMDMHLFVSLFKLDLAEIGKHITIFNTLFLLHISELHGHFSEIQVMPEQYLLGWITTIFNQVLPLKTTVLIWDGFMTEGEVYIYRTAVALLKLLKTQLLHSNFEECMKTLKQMQHGEIDQIALLETVDSITVPNYLVELVSKFKIK